MGVELLMSQDPNHEAPIFIKAFPRRTYKLHPGVYNDPLGTSWSATDEEIADAFVARAQDIIATNSA